MTIGNKGERAGMFYNLQGLALTRNLNLVVVHFNNTFGLQIFSSLYLVVFIVRANIKLKLVAYLTMWPSWIPSQVTEVSDQTNQELISFLASSHSSCLVRLLSRLSYQCRF